MENTTKMELAELFGIYERGETTGTQRGLRIGAAASLSAAAIALALLFAAGLIVIRPPSVRDSTPAVPPAVQAGPPGHPPAPPLPGIVPSANEN